MNIAIKKKTQAKRKHHYKDDHQNDDQTRVVPNEKKKNYSKDKLFCCYICGVTFSSSHAMRPHMRVHDGYRFICRSGMCYKFFTTKHNLQEHKLSHTGERPHICKVCNARFRQASTLCNHLKVHSTEEKRFSCAYCAYKTTWKKCLKRHSIICSKKHDSDGKSLLELES